MRLDGVEIKISIGGSQVATALAALGLGDNGQRRSINFLEDLTVGTELPLFHQGIVLRVRQTDRDSDDSTVKLRPCRRSQLAERWLDENEGDGWKLRVEEDWAGSRRMLAASCVADIASRRIAAVGAGTEPVRRLFNSGQERFLTECATVRVNLDALTLLPQVNAVRWRNVQVDGIPGVIAERWTAGDLDFLELSMRSSSVDEAHTMQQGLEDAVRRLGLARDDENASKTEQLLKHLAAVGKAGSLTRV